MRARLVKSRIVKGRRLDFYTCDKAGDGLELHSHLFNHFTQVRRGVCEAFDGAGKTLELTRNDPRVHFAAGRRHGIRAKTDGARFVNISPVLG